MLSSNIVWPTPGEYDSALQNRRTTFTDPDIQHGLLYEIAGRPARLNSGSGKYVCVYRVGNWVVRCFTSNSPYAPPPADIQLRYRVISAYFSRLRSSLELSFLVPHIWVERGVNVGGDTFPFLKVPFIQTSQPLGDFLIDHHTDSHAMNLLSHQWFDLVERLESRQIAHGDLGMTNVLVCGILPNLSLKLIDFDGMYVPDLAPYNLRVAGAGHKHFQPAQPGIRTFGPQMDRFSVLIIYITLSALTTNQALWENCDADETRPLLKRDDFDRLGLSKNFIRLLQERNNKDLQKCLQELQDSVMQRRMPRSLAEILNRSGTLYTVKETPLYGDLALPIPIPVDPWVGPTPLLLPQTQYEGGPPPPSAAPPIPIPVDPWVGPTPLLLPQTQYEGGPPPPSAAPPKSLRRGNPILDILRKIGLKASKTDESGSRQTKTLPLFAIARATLETDDRALVGKYYTVQAGIAQSKPENFSSEPFDLPVRNLAEPIWFDILLHTSENVEIAREWHNRLRYDLRNPEPQLVTFMFRLVAPGHSSLAINFYRERRWLKTIRLEFETVEQLKSTTASLKGG